jgi:sodium/potassium/calcium exchanger 6
LHSLHLLDTDHHKINSEEEEKHKEHHEQEQELEQHLVVETKEEIKKRKKQQRLFGLTWPAEKHWVQKIQYIIEIPVSIMRWLSIPMLDSMWDWRRRWFTIFSPPGMLLISLIGFVDDFTTYYVGSLPVWALLIIIGAAFSVVIFFTTKPDQKPSVVHQWLFSISSFIASLAWLDIFADQLVGIVQVFGLIWNINTGVMGLTFLAFGDAIGDWVVDVLIAREGNSSMGFMSIFGSAFLNQCLGTSLPVLYWSFVNYPQVLSVDINTTDFHLLQLGWGFMLLTLGILGVAFPYFKFQPPRWFGVFLIILYGIFIGSIILLNRLA